MGGNIIAGGDDKALEAVVKASELTTVNLFSVFKHPLGTPVDFNPNVVCAAEKVGHVPGIKTGEDYLFHTKKVLENSPIQIVFVEPISTDSQGFGVMQTDMTMMGITIHQHYFVKVLKGYAVTFVMSYATEQERAEVQSIMNSVEDKNSY